MNFLCLVTDGGLGSQTILKDDHLSTISFNMFRRVDFNIMFYQNMPNLHNLYKSAEKKFTEKPGRNVELLIAM